MPRKLEVAAIGETDPLRRPASRVLNNCSVVADTLVAVRALGVSCSTSTAYLSLSVDGEIVAEMPLKVEVGSLLEASVELAATMDEFSRAYGRLRPARVALLLPEHTPTFKRTYREIAPRAALETLARLAAVRDGIPVEVLARPTVRARLELPKRGNLASLVSTLIDAPVGSYWSEGRDVAALAALATADDGP